MGRVVARIGILPFESQVIDVDSKVELSHLTRISRHSLMFRLATQANGGRFINVLS